MRHMASLRRLRWLEKHDAGFLSFGQEATGRNYVQQTERAFLELL